MEVLRDPNSGAVIFRYTEEELRPYRLEKEVQALRARVTHLEEEVKKLKEAIRCLVSDTEE